MRNGNRSPPPPEAVPDCLQHWKRFLHDESLPPLIHAGPAHAQFKAIHPFPSTG